MPRQHKRAADAPRDPAKDPSLDSFRPPIRCQLRAQLDEQAERLALRAVLAAARLFGLAAGTHLRQLRNLGDPLAEMQARLQEAELQAKLAWEVVEILRARFDKLPEKQRPHYSPAQRFRALEIRTLLGWPRDITARVFLVCANTITNWERSANPETKTAGSLVKPTPPVRRFADVVRATVQMLARCGFAEDMAAQVLGRAGIRISAHSVRRIARERPSTPPLAPEPPAKKTHPVIARFVHHTWMMDVTEIQAFLNGQTFYLAGVFDAFSRVPLVFDLSPDPPTASRMARLLRTAVKAFTAPKYLITDLGTEFTGRIFKKMATRLQIKQRFASADNIYATARLERFWRTLKDIASLRLQRPLVIEDLERRLETALAYYLAFRPHQGLLGATPAESFLGVEPANANAASPPRGRPGEGPRQPQFTVEYLDPLERHYPVLCAAA